MSVARIVAWLAIGLLLCSTGCGKSGEAGSSPPTTSIPGGSATPTTTPAPPGGSSATAKTRGNSDPLHPVVQIDTSLGKLLVTLDKEKAPLTVDNFLNYVDQQFYDQTIFHQVLKDYVVLGGAFNTNRKEKQASYPVRNEAQNGLRNLRTTIAMARLPNVIDSATCQFFINVTDNKALDYQGETPEAYGYCVFGKVTEGMEVIDKIANVKVKDEGDFERIPEQTVMINSIRRIR